MVLRRRGATNSSLLAPMTCRAAAAERGAAAGHCKSLRLGPAARRNGKGGPPCGRTIRAARSARQLRRRNDPLEHDHRVGRHYVAAIEAMRAGDRDLEPAHPRQSRRVGLDPGRHLVRRVRAPVAENTHDSTPTNADGRDQRPTSRSTPAAAAAADPRTRAAPAADGEQPLGRLRPSPVGGGLADELALPRDAPVCIGDVPVGLRELRGLARRHPPPPFCCLVACPGPKIARRTAAAGGK